MRQGLARHVFIVSCIFLGLLYGLVLYNDVVDSARASMTRIKNNHTDTVEFEYLTSGVNQTYENISVATTHKLDTTITEAPEDNYVLPILVLACNRHTVTRCLDKLIQYRPSATRHPIVLSQDCNHDLTRKALEAYESQIAVHIIQPDSSPVSIDPVHTGLEGYYQIARHYGWALNMMFNTFNYSSAVVVEDDLDVAPDFFEYFTATLPLLKQDPTLYCVSAWNDNGRTDRVNLDTPEVLHRTDFFPGLGWMLRRKLWNEIGSRWPNRFWDEWLRSPEQRKGRACIRPEISRTFNFGKEGVSNGMYYETHLKFIKLHDHFVKFTSLDLSYLEKENYDKEFIARVKAATFISAISEVPATQKTLQNDEMSISKFIASVPDIPVERPTRPEFQLEYYNHEHFKKLAQELQIMEDFWNDVPRMGYFGIVSTMVSNHRLYLVPSETKFEVKIGDAWT